MKTPKKFIFIVAIVLFALTTSLNVEARSGCCSHHGGVCGCGCCDGTGLSATCAPYYPECNDRPTPVPTPIKKQITVPTPTPVQTQPAQTTETPNQPPTQQPITIPTNLPKQKNSESDNSFGWLVGVVSVGVIGYFIGKKKK